MNKHLATILAMTTSLLSTVAFAAPGEYWEVTSKMEMPGMPFAMPATTQKNCIPKGEENNPSATSGDKDCQMTDIKTVGNKTSWKARCDHNGEVMTGSGEQASSANGYEGKMQLSGKSSGEDVNMTMTFSGKRVGGSCDTEEKMKKIQSETCDSSHLKTTRDWIGSAVLYLRPDTPCPGNKEELCRRVRQDAPIDADVYSSLVLSDSRSNTRIAQECGLDMPAATIAICKTLNDKNIQELTPYCLAEARAYRENERRKSCEGRSYTASTRDEGIKKCMGDKDLVKSPDDSMPTEAPAALESAIPSDNNPAADVLETARKLKGLFGR